MKTNSFNHTNSLSPLSVPSQVQNCSIALKKTIQCVVFAVGPLLPTSTLRPLDAIHVMNETRPSSFFAVSSTSVYNSERKPKNKKKKSGKAWDYNLVSYPRHPHPSTIRGGTGDDIFLSPRNFRIPQTT